MYPRCDSLLCVLMTCIKVPLFQGYGLVLKWSLLRYLYGTFHSLGVLYLHWCLLESSAVSPCLSKEHYSSYGESPRISPVKCGWNISHISQPGTLPCLVTFVPNLGPLTSMLGHFPGSAQLRIMFLFIHGLICKVSQRLKMFLHLFN